MIKNLRDALDKGGVSVLLLTDFLKAFDCLLHDHLIATLHKLHTYKIGVSFLKRLSCLTKTKTLIEIRLQFGIRNFISSSTGVSPLVFTIQYILIPFIFVYI